MIEAKIIADSINTATNDRLTTFLLTYPRYIHAEVMTHRVFSRNAASSRAIPVAKFRKDVAENPVIPSHWGANQKGMQAAAELDDVKEEYSEGPHIYVPGLLTARAKAKQLWLLARNQMLCIHKSLEDVGLHKQIANRIIEPWFHIQLLVSATEYGNFFALRCHEAAHPDIQALADAMLAQYMTYPVEKKNPGEWHLPFNDQGMVLSLKERIKVCTARCARVSYKLHDGNKSSYVDDLVLHDRLAASGHWSPFEHPAQAGEQAHGMYGNFRGWRQYRKMFTTENNDRPDLAKLWEERKKNGTPYAHAGWQTLLPAQTIRCDY